MFSSIKKFEVILTKTDLVEGGEGGGGGGGILSNILLIFKPIFWGVPRGNS